MSIHQRPYGVGLGHRNVVHAETLAHRDEIDVLEIFTENYIVRRRRLESDPDLRLLREATERFPCVAHGVNLSIGAVDPLNQRALRATSRLLRETGIRLLSEHLCFHQMEPRNLSFFMSLPFDDVSIDWVAENYRAARSLLGCDFALENVSTYFPVPHCPYDEPTFLTKILERTGTTLLLDVTNVYNNCVNHGQDPVEYIHGLPGDRIRQVHLAGGHYEDGFLKDSHSHPVMEEVWDLFDETLRHTSAEVAIIEQDDNFEPFSRVLEDVRRAREIFYRHRPSEPPAAGPNLELQPPRRPDRFPDPATTEFANLRNFQHALLREITDDHFRLQIRWDDETVRRLYSMSDEWFQRWRDCPRDRIDYLAEVWEVCEREQQQSDERFRRWEWSNWARALPAG